MDRFVLVAGELSGDILGAGLMRALRKRLPGVRFAGIGGPRMCAAGLEPWAPLNALSIMGLVEVVRHLPALLRLRAELQRRIADWGASLFIGIDAPDFNLGLERRVRASGVRTVHYVSPSVWAWRQGRVHSIARSVDLMLTLLPFEAAFYQAHGVPVQWVGHPLADQIPLETDREAARADLGLPAGRWLALLPGSRKGEVERLAPLFLGTARWVRARAPDVGIVLPAASAELHAYIASLLASQGEETHVHLIQGQAQTAMAAADAVLVASGTATLEAMLIRRPMVVAYRVAPATAWLARWLIKVRRFALPNLLAGENLVPELIQRDARVERMGPAVLRILQQPDPSLIERFRALHLQLRRNADERAADAVVGLLRGKAAPVCT